MQKHNISSLDELSQKSKDDLEWFWKEVIRLAEGRRSGRGESDRREHLLMCIAAKEYTLDVPFGIFEVNNGYLTGIKEANVLVKGGKLYAEASYYMDGLSPADRQGVLRSNLWKY